MISREIECVGGPNDGRREWLSDMHSMLMVQLAEPDGAGKVRVGTYQYDSETDRLVWQGEWESPGDCISSYYGR